MKLMKLAGLIALISLTMLACTNPAGSDSGYTPPPAPPADPGLPVGDGTVWYYRAFGQSVDLKFHNNANGPNQDGINNVWINPSWVAQATSAIANWNWTNIGGSTTDTSDDDPGASFVPSAAQIAEAIGTDQPVTLGSLGSNYQIVLESRGGKISNGHDGATYFFTVLPTDKLYTLSVDITNLYSGPHPDNRATGGNATTRNSQAGGGVMIRDVLGSSRKNPAVIGFEEVPAISNIVGGGWRSAVNATSLYRDGCTSLTNATGVPSAGAGNGGTQSNVAQAGVKTTYILERKNDGFYWSIKDSGGNVLKGSTRITSNSDLVQRVDRDKMYWGVYAARETRLMVENIVLTDNGPATITPTNPPSSITPPTPVVTRRSPASTEVAEYVLTLRANYKGRIKIYAGTDTTQTPLKDQQVESDYEEVDVPVTLTSGLNTFTSVFQAEDERSPSDAPVNNAFTITYTVPASALTTVYAAPAAVGGDTGVDPANAKALSAAISGAQPGQTIKLIAGNYSTLYISFGSQTGGVAGKPVKIEPDAGVGNIKVRYITLGGQYVHVYNFTAGGTPGSRYSGSPVTVNGDYNTVELVTAQWATGSGFQMGGSSGSPTNAWPKYNTYLNCTAFENKDAAGADSDGYAAKRVGPGNRYIGCVAYENADDGWDFFNWVDSGPSAPILIENCIAFNHPANGFKVGGETQPVDHILKDSLTFNNIMGGVSDNFNPGRIQVTNVVSIDNGTQNFILRDNPIIPPANEVRNSLSYRTQAKKTVGYQDAISGTIINSFITDASGDSRKGARTLTDADFVSLDYTAIAAFDYSDLSNIYTRDANGDLVRGNFGKLITP